MSLYHAADKFIKTITKPKVGYRNRTRINTIIIHTTGYGAGLKRLVQRHPNNLKKIGAEYAKRMANILKYKGHFLIDHTGTIWQFANPLSEVTWHTGSGKKSQLENEAIYGWWHDKWNAKRPTLLKAWEGGSPNYSSIGIDLLAHGTGLPSSYTDAQYASLARLCLALCDDLGLQCSFETIVGHEDVDPISRGTLDGGWDPGKKFNWDKFKTYLDEDTNDVIEFETIDVRDTWFPEEKPMPHVEDIKLQEPKKWWSFVFEWLKKLFKRKS